MRADAHLPQLFRVPHGQARDAAEIIVDHAHVDTRCSLFPQELQDRIDQLLGNSAAQKIQQEADIRNATERWYGSAL